MNPSDAETLRRWVACWKETGARMEKLRREELRRIDTQQSLIALAGPFESCRLHYKPLPTSGLIEQQRWFRKLAEQSGRAPGPSPDQPSVGARSGETL